jgi:hypothetical protein
VVSARDELRHLIDCLSDDECEQALTLLEPLTRQPDPDEPEPTVVAGQ